MSLGTSTSTSSIGLAWSTGSNTEIGGVAISTELAAALRQSGGEDIVVDWEYVTSSGRTLLTTASLGSIAELKGQK